MELHRLFSTTHWLEYSSFTLNTEKFAILNNCLLILQNENHFKKIYFWGFLHCLQSDYFIAFGYQTDAILDRKFFYSEDCQNWHLLPIPQKDHLALTELCRRPFQGDPGLLIEVVDDAPLEEPSFDEGNDSEEPYERSSKAEILQEDIASDIDKIREEKANVLPATATEEIANRSVSHIEEEKVEEPITSGILKEEDRLAAFVHIITEEASILPRGGLFKQTDGVVVHSRAFEGLKDEDADELCSFLHYRNPQQDCNTNLLTRVNYNYAMDFLDTIDRDLPSDIWRAHLVEGDRAIILHNLTWPGFSFFHHLETPDYGFIYVGNGQRNLDVPFMTQVNEPYVKVEESEMSTKDSKSSKISQSISKRIGSMQSDTEDEILLPVPKETREVEAVDEIITSA